MKNKFVSGILKPYFQKAQAQLAAWIVRRPGLTLTLVILSSVILLPLVTSAALTPFVLLLDFGNFLNTKGAVFVVYMVLFQGLALAFLLVILFFIAFTFATVVSLLHSYSFFYK